MKIMITILGVLIALTGVIPFLSSIGFLPGFIPSSGVKYSILVMLIGAIGIAYGIINKMIMGLERMVTIAIAALTVLGGILPFIDSVVPSFIPTSGPFYALMIIVIGVFGIVYGVISLG